MIFGSSALENEIPEIKDEILHFPGISFKGKGFGINDDVLSKHLLLLGGSGCGKTNVFLYALDQISHNMGDQDLAVIFDTKGEFYEAFAKEGDYVIGNSPAFREISCTWNIFDEILADGEDEYSVLANAREISAALFHGRGSETQPFFCNAARDLFQGILLYFIRQAHDFPGKWRNRLNNYDLTQAFRSYQGSDYGKIFSMYPDLRYLLTYIGDGSSNQALGVFGELNSMIAEFFVGVLAKKGDNIISMRNAVRRRGGKKLFIEYDLALGESLTPIYRLLVDQALKEALGRGQKTGRCYLFVDEFKLLPKLQYIDDALNFGRGLGVRVMAGIQSINQLYDIYGRDKGEVLAGGFGSMFGFHTNDSSSREYISSRFGGNHLVYRFDNSLKNEMETKERDGKTIEEWDQLQLGVGQAVVGLTDYPPFLFEFSEYGVQQDVRTQ